MLATSGIGRDPEPGSWFLCRAVVLVWHLLPGGE